MSGERPSFLAVTLSVSVLLNLFLAGVIVGRITLPGFAPPGQAALIPREEIRALPEAERRAFIRIVRSRGPQMRALRERVREARRAAEEAIGAPQYDRKLLEARLATVRQTQEALGAAQHETVIEALGTLSPGSRAAIARRAEENIGNAP
ncbi:MAG TPA: periplasmic heavy metal sensor [Rhizomicrobium sp.]|nr:periplasmic heavy metal sensor [Rhizomicrobium sp.]